MTSNKQVWQPIGNTENDLFSKMETGEGQNQPPTAKDGMQTQTILVEIVSALRVPSMDARSEADPFVTVFLGEKEIHRTKVLKNHQNPIWTLETGSLFLLKIDSAQVNPTVATVSFVLKDYNSLSAAQTLGTLELKLKDIIKGKGQRKEYSLIVPEKVLEFNKKRKRRVSKKSKLVLRYKPASAEEIHFMKTLRENQDGIFAGETYLPPRESRKEKKLPQIKGWGAKLLATGTGELSESDTLLVEALKPSLEWIDVGSGSEGRVYLEIIAADGLPNLDAATIRNFNNMTDPYCCIILEDSIVNTSIIKDCLSPRWMPCDRRAFVFHVHHPSSQLFVGVFDYDKLNRPGNVMRQRVHDPVGRIVLNLTQFNPDTLYTLHYHLYMADDDSGKNRKEQNHRGRILLRLRVEWGDECCQKNETKNMLMAGMMPPEQNYLSVPTTHDFRTAHYTTVGERDKVTFSMTTLTGYIEELQGYFNENAVDFVIDACFTVLFWRGHFQINLWCCKPKLPVHSIVAFTWGIMITQDFNRFLSFLLFSIGWFFLATMEVRRNHPSPWHKCKSYVELLGALLAGTFCGYLGDCGSLGVERRTIVANENLPEIQAYSEAAKKREDELANQMQEAAEHVAEMQEEDIMIEVEMGPPGGDVSVATMRKDTFLSKINPLKPILHPVQNRLHEICISLRVIKSIVTWEENFYPFWIATAAFVAALLLFFIPWGWIFRWIIRIVVWVFLGPWMKIVDWVYFEKIQHMTTEEKEEQLKQQIHEKYEQTLAERMQSQQRKERNLKLQSMMKYLFGKNMLLSKVCTSGSSVPRGAIFGLPASGIHSRALSRSTRHKNIWTNLWADACRKYDPNQNDSGTSFDYRKHS